ncbi:IclR family transcriptional regulator [Kiloniella litopenaei]|uniref:IclR family transcriptional regulator n=1 Tax=Kiloniella litopenaei TaxID=1549748 RepID=A0A0M2R6A0_9PROT|nr:IclR family transcriptional regulator [Kiloniella litopenaei]KKJ75545.1 IclR family transcriptional regulator [Kiloniella litopenaei]
MADEKKKVNQRARGLERAFDILDLIRRENRAMRPNEIAKLMGAPRSSVYELVHLLLDMNVLENNGSDGQVFLGSRLYFLGRAYNDKIDLYQRIENTLSNIVEQTSETAQFCKLEGNKYTVALMKEGSRPFRISANLGELVPVPSTASGRLLLGHLSDQEIIDFLDKDDFLLPNGESISPGNFITEVRQATQDGHYTFDSIVDTFTHCFAVPIKDAQSTCIATLCLVTPREDGHRNKEHYLSVLKTAATELEAQLSTDF